MPHPPSELKFLLDTAETNTLMKSKKHCHARNVSSVVLKDNVGMLTRVFLAWPGHQLHENELLDGAMPIGIHDHKYNLELKRVVGRVQSVEYVKGSRGPLLKHWCFASGQATNPPEIGLRGYANLNEIIRFDLDDHFMPLHYQRLHNIICCEEKAAWIVRERDTVQFVTNLFTREESLTFDGLYEPFDSVDEVRQHVADFMSL